MRGYLLDTNALSELRKPRPNAGYVRWLADVNEAMLYTTSVTIGELRLGIQLKADGRSRDDLERWLVSDVGRRFEGRILPFDRESADRWGRLEAKSRQSSGPPLPLLDGMIAAIALQYDFPIVTRNERDFVRAGVPVINPWTA